MKIILFAIIVIATINSCSTAPEAKIIADKVDIHQFGFNYDSSANIDAVKALNKDIENLDTTNYKTKFSDTVVFYDHEINHNLNWNMSIFKNWIAKKTQPKVSVGAIWGSKFNYKDGSKGDYVYQAIKMKFTQGTKSVEFDDFGVFEFKDGKIVKEWNWYDATNLLPLMK